MKVWMTAGAMMLASWGVSAQTWTYCAAENQTCNFSGDKQVRFGTTAKNVIRNLTGPVNCTTTVFGSDPAPGETKGCWHAPLAAAPVTPNLQSSRTTGVAPLAVLFDATASTATGVSQPFRELTYNFTFGDARGQTWAYSGRSKNEQNGGPIAAHVYELPGTYTAKVRVQKSDGTYAETTQTITVQDPNVVYAGTKTVCVTQGDSVGCPSGAAFAAAIPSALSGKRVLLRRGGTFGAINPQNTDTGFQVGAFGSGAKPVVDGLGVGSRNGVAAWTNDFVVMDLDLGRVSVEATTARMTLLRNDIKRSSEDSVVNIGTAATWYYENGGSAVAAGIYWPKEVFLVENDILGRVGTTRQAPILTVMGWFTKSALLGNSIDRADEHSLRIWAGNKLAISHNRIGGNHRPEADGIGIRHAVKLHSGGLQPWTSNISGSRAPMTNQVVMANNVLGSTTFPGSWTSVFGPENNTSVQGLEDCIAENNEYVRGPISSSSKSDFQARGRRIVARGNTLRGGGVPNIVRNGATYPAALDTWDGPYYLQTN